MDKLTRRQWRNVDAMLGGDGTFPASIGVKAPVARSNKPKLHPSEWQEQVSVVAWWNQQCAAWGYDYRHLFAIPNSGNISTGGSDPEARRVAMIRMARLKSAGLRVGAPDLMLAIPMPPNAGLFIEMKARGGRVAEEQHDYHAILRKQYAVSVAYGADEARKAIREYLGRT
jgi:hypothetical protein